MIVTCIAKRASDLADHQRGRLKEIESIYDLTVGQDYVVVGIIIWETTLELLVLDNNGLASFAPAGLFRSPAQLIPRGWSFALGPGIGASGRELWLAPLVATWGYEALVHDPGHLTSLVDGDENAVALFRTELRRQESAHSEGT